MQLTPFVTVLALLGSSFVAAQTSGFDAITSPTQDQNLTAGSSFDIVWEPSTDGTISITLLEGSSPSTLELGDSIATGIDNSVGTYTWTVPSAQYSTYGFKISLDSDPSTFQYSFPFHIVGTSSGGSSSGSATSSTSSASKTSSKTASVTSTSTVVSVTSTASSNGTSSETSAPASSSQATGGNASTLVTSVTATSTASLGAIGTSSTASSSSASASSSTGAAVSNMASGGMGAFGLLLSFAVLL